MIQSHTVLVRSARDAYFICVGDPSENELLLHAVLDGLYNAMSSLLHHSMDFVLILDHIDALMLAVDETVDKGAILELDPEAIANRVLMRSSEPSPLPSEMTISEALGVLRDQMSKQSDGDW